MALLALNETTATWSAMGSGQVNLKYRAKPTVESRMNPEIVLKLKICERATLPFLFLERQFVKQIKQVFLPLSNSFKC